ncbi:MAG: hypothetical protein ACI7YS_00535 [Flavobacterium sp.]
MRVERFEDRDYKILNNGYAWIGQPLGLKSMFIHSILFVLAIAFVVFLVPSRRSPHKTFYSQYGLESTLVFSVLLFLFMIGLMIYLYWNKNIDYQNGTKYVFNSRIESVEKKQKNIYTIVNTNNREYLGQLKFNTKLIPLPMDLDKEYAFEVAPESGIVLACTIEN